MPASCLGWHRHKTNDELVLINALIVGRGGGLSDGQAIRKSLHMVRTLFCLQTKYVLGVEY